MNRKNFDENTESLGLFFSFFIFYEGGYRKKKKNKKDQMNHISRVSMLLNTIDRQFYVGE